MDNNEIEVGDVVKFEGVAERFCADGGNFVLIRGVWLETGKVEFVSRPERTVSLEFTASELLELKEILGGEPSDECGPSDSAYGKVLTAWEGLS